MHYNYRWRWIVRQAAIYRLKSNPPPSSPPPHLTPAIFTPPTSNSHSSSQFEEVDKFTHTFFFFWKEQTYACAHIQPVRLWLLGSFLTWQSFTQLNTTKQIYSHPFFFFSITSHSPFRVTGYRVQVLTICHLNVRPTVTELKLLLLKRRWASLTICHPTNLRCQLLSINHHAGALFSTYTGLLLN